jgi:hypothetical protein
MSLRSCVVVIGLSVLFSANFMSSSMAADGAVSDQRPDAPVMSLAPVPVPVVTAFHINENVTRELLVKELHLEMFTAAMGDLSVCGESKKCLKHAKRLKHWMCASEACSVKDESKPPIDCFKEEWDQQTPQTLKQINEVICPIVESPGPEARQALVKFLPDNVEGDLVETEALLIALKKKSAAVCEEHIKNYIGSYGPQWTYVWYTGWSGCRILSGERTLEQENKDFHTWLGAIQGVDKCSNILNEQMREACNTPKATSPQPVDD